MSFENPHLIKKYQFNCKNCHNYLANYDFGELCPLCERKENDQKRTSKAKHK